jgi:hypothetical protein
VTDRSLILTLRHAVYLEVVRADARVARRLRTRREAVCEKAAAQGWDPPRLAAEALQELGSDGDTWDCGPLAVRIVDAFLRQSLGKDYPSDSRTWYEREMVAMLKERPDPRLLLDFYSNMCAP